MDYFGQHCEKGAKIGKIARKVSARDQHWSILPQYNLDG